MISLFSAAIHAARTVETLNRSGSSDWGKIPTGALLLLPNQPTHFALGRGAETGSALHGFQVDRYCVSRLHNTLCHWLSM